ncbi:MAG: ATP-binding protein [bacterium]
MKIENDVYRTLVENVDFGMVLVNSDYTIDMANTAYRKLFNKSFDNVKGRECFRTFGRRDSICPDCPGKAAIASRKPQVLETEFVRDDGSHFWAYIYAFPVMDKDGSVNKFIEVIEDITARKKQELALKKAKELAEQVCEAKSQFLACISNEIREPMNVILNYSELLDTRGLEDDQKDYIETICGATEVLLALVNDFVDVSRIEAGELKLQSIDFDLVYLIESALKIISPKIGDKDIALEYKIAENMPVSFNGDPTRIRQIFLNLLTNAIKYTEKGRIRITISLEELFPGELDRGVCMVKISVQDTGIGIAKEKQKEIFSAFHQVDGTLIRNKEGSGLGLSITKSLVEMMGGEILVESELGKGSEFIVTLKLKEAASVSKGDVNPMHLEQLKGKKILIVGNDDEDEPGILADYCQEVHMKVLHQAESPDEAFYWLLSQSEMPDIVFVNLKMSDPDGYELAERVGVEEKFNDIKLVAIAKEALPGAAKRLQEYGFDAFLPRPFVKRDLIRIIQITLGDTTKGGPIKTRHMAAELFLKGIRFLFNS